MSTNILQQRAIVSSLEADAWHLSRELDRAFSTETSRFEDWMRESHNQRIERLQRENLEVSKNLKIERDVLATMMIEQGKADDARRETRRMRNDELRVKLAQQAVDEIDFIY
jgi:hypothetical protein